MIKIAVLASRQGSLLTVIHKSGIEISLVIADRKCPALSRARGFRIKAERVARKDFIHAFDARREEYTLRLLHVLRAHDIGLVVMAGFMTILSPVLFEHYKGRVLNIHPALLPRFKGKNAIEETLAAGVKWTGSTVHIATAEVDSGTILARSRVEIVRRDTPKALEERLKKKECLLYPWVIKEYLRVLQTP